MLLNPHMLKCTSITPSYAIFLQASIKHDHNLDGAFQLQRRKLGSPGNMDSALSIPERLVSIRSIYARSCNDCLRHCTLEIFVNSSMLKTLKERKSSQLKAMYHSGKATSTEHEQRVNSTNSLSFLAFTKGSIDVYRSRYFGFESRLTLRLTYIN